MGVPMEPASLVHPAFGRADWDEERSCYSGQYEMGAGRVIRLFIQPFTDCVPGQEPAQLEEPSRLTNAVADRVEDLSNRIEEVKAFAARELLTTFNEGDWCQGSPIDAASFSARLTLTDVTVDQDLTTQMFFDDGDLFWGHARCVVFLEHPSSLTRRVCVRRPISTD